MIKLGETSPLELPIRLLAKMSYMERYYAGDYRRSSHYEHVWTGFVICAVASLFMILSQWAALAVVPAFLMHVVWKQVIYDAPKRTTPAEWLAFWANLTESTSGFVLGSPFIIISLMRG